MSDNPMEHSVRVGLIKHFVAWSISFLVAIGAIDAVKHIASSGERMARVGYVKNPMVVTNSSWEDRQTVIDGPGTNDTVAKYPLADLDIEIIGYEWVRR